MRYGLVAMLVLTLGAAACDKAEKTAPGSVETGSPIVETPGPAETAASTAATESPVTASVPASDAASPAPAPIVPAKLSALGTEPFWNAQIDGTTLTYTTPEDQNGKRIAIVRRDTAIGAVFSGSLGSAQFVLTVTKRTCSDGMSDREYPLRTVLMIGTERRVGCAS